MPFLASCPYRHEVSPNKIVTSNAPLLTLRLETTNTILSGRITRLATEDIPIARKGELTDASTLVQEKCKFFHLGVALTISEDRPHPRPDYSEIPRDQIVSRAKRGVSLRCSLEHRLDK